MERTATGTRRMVALAAILCLAGAGAAVNGQLQHRPHARAAAPAAAGPLSPSGGRAGGRVHGGAGVSSTPVVEYASRHDVSPPLRELAALRPTTGEAEDPDQQQPRPARTAPSATGPDAALQTTPGAAGLLDAGASFDGLASPDAGGWKVPDTNGDVSPTQYVEWVNAAFAVYSKNGTRLYGPAAGNTLWAGFGGPCETLDDGDPVVQYDQLANRWLLSQFAIVGSSGPYWQCIAVSTTGDATGSYYRYAYLYSDTIFNDYPKFGVWPDGYYMSVREFPNLSLDVHGGVVAFDRAKMLAGQDAAMIRFQTPEQNLLPGDLDGTVPPPSGAPDTFVGPEPGSTNLVVYALHADWANPAASSLTGPAHVPVAGYGGCDYACIPQPGTAIKLDAFTDLPMYRLAYRNLGPVQALVLNLSVNVAGPPVRMGVRWYELRRHGTGPWSLFQQGTYSPDTDGRFMGSVAMDRDGDLGAGYSVSGAATYPSLRYTGRLTGDPAGTLQAEATLIAGGGSETHAEGRWGDYSSLSVDPADDCTFWYVGEYYPQTSERGWHTRIGSFRFPGCKKAPAILDFSPASAPVGATISILGHNLGGTTAVAFGGIPASFRQVSSTKVTATIPAGATTSGVVSVTTGNGTASSPYTYPISPTVSSFSPTSGPAGTRVTITGLNLAGATEVDFNGLRTIYYTVDSPAQISATVPTNASTGPVTITTPAGSGTSAGAFTVTSPFITGLTPASAAAGQVVTIDGANFTGTTLVRFGNLTGAFTVVSPTRISATVPANAVSAPVTVTTPLGTGTGQKLTITSPALTSASPPSAPTGAAVTLVGANLAGVTSVTFNGASASFTVKSATQIATTVPAGATSGAVAVVAPAGSTTSGFVFRVSPAVTGFSPASGGAGASVTITGTSFVGITGVRFNNVVAAYHVDSATQITATVPANATTGKILVQGTEGLGTSAAAFAVTSPAITGVTPSLGPVGTAVTITGANFTGATAVAFNGVPASFTVASPTKLTTTAPSGATTGFVTVTTPGGTATGATRFTVVPGITGFTPASGPAGGTVTITGTSFTGAGAVRFNGLAATSFSVDSDAQITATVPANATSGKLTVTTPAGTGTSVASFTVTTPSVSSFSPSIGPVGTLVTINGANLAGATGVSFGGVAAASFSVVSAVKMTATVPAGAATGPIAVANGAGTTVSAATFRVTPTISSFSPASGPVGTSVAIVGTGLTGVTGVRFNGAAATFTPASPTEVDAVVPTGARTGTISVTTPGGTATSAASFTVG